MASGRETVKPARGECGRKGTEKMRKHWTDGLWERTKNLLDQAGIKTLAQLAATSEFSLLRNKGLGRKTIKQLKEKLQANGLEMSAAPYRPTRKPLPKWIPKPPNGMQWEEHRDGIGLRQPWGHIRLIPVTREKAIRMRKEAAMLTSLADAHYAAARHGAIASSDMVDP